MPESMTRDLPMQDRAASFVPATADDERRTIELVWTTGARVPRYDYFRGRRYFEELVVSANAVDMTRFASGQAPLLDSHRLWSGVEGVLGIVERAWLVGSEGRALVRFGKDDEAAESAWRKVRDGIVRNVSVGYFPRKIEMIEEEGKPPVYRVVDWEPFEISLVPVGADAGAGTRSAEQRMHPCEFVTRAPAQPTERTMPNDHPAGGQPAVTAPAATTTAAAAPANTETRANPPAETAAVPTTQPAAQDPAAIRAAERGRIAEIQKIGRLAGLDEAAVRTMIEEGTSIDDARTRAFAAMAERSPQPRPAVAVISDEQDTTRTLVENALLNRHDGSIALEAGAREWRGLTLMEIGDELLRRRGVTTRGLGKMERAGAMLGLVDGGMRSLHTTSDFPIILANVAGKSLRRAYDAAPQTFRPFCRRVTLPDFKQVTRVQMGDAPSLVKVNEHGEFKRGTVGESKEVWSLATYGRVVGITRQVIVNDDLDAFTRLPAMFGRAAADLESDIVWSIITDNAAMGDTIALFHADHGNLATTATAPAIASLGAARTAMRKQTSLDGRFINVQGRFLMAPPELETVVQQLLAAVVANQNSQVNPFSGAYTALIEPRLSASSETAWYLSAHPDQIDTIEFGYLQGEEGVMLESRIGFDVDGLEVKARLDFGAKAIDWRGLYKNAG